MKDIVQQYLATWNATGDERARLISEHWSPEATYTDPMAEVCGHDGITAIVDGVQAQFPGWVFTRSVKPTPTIARCDSAGAWARREPNRR